MSERYDPAGDPDAVLCPAGCDRLTDDISGGVCSVCADEADDALLARHLAKLSEWQQTLQRWTPKPPGDAA